MTLKIVAAGLAALFITASPPAYAEAPTEGQRLSAADLERLTESRINIVKAALQLTPDQEKYWPAIEDAIRARAKDRQTRLQNAVARVADLRDRSPIEVLRDRNPIEFLNRRADALAQRSAELKQLAAAWQPLYASLSPEQKQRLRFFAVHILRMLPSTVEQAVELRRMQEEESDEN